MEVNKVFSDEQTFERRPRGGWEFNKNGDEGPAVRGRSMATASGSEGAQRGRGTASNECVDKGARDLEAWWGLGSDAERSLQKVLTKVLGKVALNG